MLTTAAFWQALLESLYTGLLGLDTTGYRTQDSDAWTQRTDMRREWVPRHLAASFELVPVAEVKADHYAQAAKLSFTCRYRPTDDSESQAVMMAATCAAREWLLGWSHRDSRVLTVSHTPQARDEQNNVVVLDFVLFIHRS